MDFALGPNQGQGVPAVEDTDGLMWDLFSYNISVPLGGSFNDVLPGWGMGSLQAVVTALVTSSANISGLPSTTASLNATGVPPSLPGDEAFNRTQVTLATDSLQVVTSQADADGHLDLQFPSNATGLEYNIFVIYLIHSDYRAQQDPANLQGPQTVPQSYLQNGSWAVDHFSALGAQTVTAFWEQHVLTNGTKELLISVGNYAWEDSIEIRSNVFWTKDFPSLFSADHGYDLTKWLPILFHQNKIGFDTEPPVWWITDEVDAGNSHIADYRETLGDLYGVYVQALNTWAEGYLDVQFSAQISYNLPMDMLQNVPNVDAPECESLGFNHLIDGYRQYAGPANLAGKRVISSELGANHLEAYQQTMPELIWDVKRSIAGSVNQFVFHGYPFSGSYGNTTWPGFTTFDYAYSEMHGRRQPAWDFASDTIDFVARLQYIFQSGIPKIDLAFYQKITTFPNIVRNYEPTDLEAAGYSYEYISPDNFALPEAYVQDATFAPTRQAFRAMIVRANDSMTTLGVSKLAEYANTGLPIIFSGGLPAYLATYDQTENDYFTRVLSSLTSLSNVHVVPYKDLAVTIASLAISPMTKVSANSTWYTYWRHDASERMDYIFIYNDADDLRLGNGFSEGVVEFASTGIPYHFDAWTGEQTPILNYTQSSTSTTIFFQLAGNQSITVAFASSPLNGSSVPSEHVTSAEAGILDFSYAPGLGFIAKGGPGTSNLSLKTSDNKTHTVPSTSAAPTTLTNWTLIVESWSPSSNLSDSLTTVKTNATFMLGELTSWQYTPGLQNVSGRGYYSTSFTWPPAGSSSSSNLGAVIDFGAIFHTVRVSINNHTLPPLDLTWARADISEYLVQGQNTVEAVVATPLLNVLRPIWEQLRSSGGPPQFEAAPAQDYGLLKPVVITPYIGTVIG